MRRHRLITSILCAAVLGPAAGAAQASTCPGADAPASAATAQDISATTLCLLNEQRAAAGIPALTAAPQLGQMAVTYAHLMATENFFSHVSPEGQTLQDRLSAAGYRFSAAGENLAWAGGTTATPDAIVQAWMQSPGHRANILDRDFRQLGVGLATSAPTSADGASIAYVTEFGTPLAAPHAAGSATRPAAARRHARARHSRVRRARARTARVRAARHRQHRAHLRTAARRHRALRWASDDS